MRKIISMILSAAIICPIAVSTVLPVKAEDNRITVILNDEALSFDTEPIIVNDRVLVPMRSIFEELGCYVEWDDTSKTATGTHNGTVIKIMLNSEVAVVDNELYTLDQSAIIKDDRVLVPTRFVSEALGAEVTWNENTRTVNISKESAYQYILGDVNSFSDLGTWTISSGCLLGKTDADISSAVPAVMKLNVAEAGTYHLWVKARDYATNQPGSRYFTAAVDSVQSKVTFGKHGKEGFVWTDGGTFELSSGEHTVSLIDTSAFYPRCSGVLLTNQDDFVPPEDDAELNKITKPLDPFSDLPATVYPLWTKKTLEPERTASIENDSFKLNFYQCSSSYGTVVQNEIYAKNNGEWIKLKDRTEENAYLLMKAKSSTYYSTVQQEHWFTQQIEYNGVTRERLTKDYYDAGIPSWFIPESFEQKSDLEIVLHSSNSDGTLDISFSFDELCKEPKLIFNAKFNNDGAYSFLMYSGDGVKFEDYDTVTAPLLYVKKAIPETASVLSEPFMYTPMYTLNYEADNDVKTPGLELTSGLAVDPENIPQDYAYPDTGRYGVVFWTPDNLVRPQVCAPLFGTEACNFKANDTYTFSCRILNSFSGWYDVMKHVAEDMYNVSDIRTNYYTSFNDAIYNTSDLWLDDLYGGWDPKAMAYYNIEGRDLTTQSNPIEAVQKYLLTEDEKILDTRTVPTIAYVLSRKAQHFKYNDTEGGAVGVYAKEVPGTIGAPMNYESYVFGSLYEMTQGRMPYLLDYALNDASATTLMSQKMMYKYTGDETIYKNIIAQADELLRNNTNTGDSRMLNIDGFVLRKYMDMLSTFIPAYEITGDEKYLKGAEEGGRLLCTSLATTGYQNNYAENDYTIDPEKTSERIIMNEISPFFWHGDFQWRMGNDIGDFSIHREALQKETVPGWLPAQTGLGTEHQLTPQYGAYITMNVWAGNLMKLAGYTGDDYFAVMARNAMIGRFGNYVGYYLDRYTAHQQKADYPYTGPDYTSIYYHHIPVFMAMLDDYLINSVWYESNRNIEFPNLYQGGYAYFDTNQYGYAPGKFYDEEDMWLWLDRGIINTENVNTDYICAKKDGVLGIALLNEDNKDMTTTISLGEKIEGGSKFNGEGVLYDADGNKQTVKIANGSFDVTIPSKGIMSVIINIPTVKEPSYANKYSYSNKLGNTVSEHTDGKGFVIQVDKDVYHAYVYVTDMETQMSSLTINYQIGNETYSQTVNSYPFEFLIKVDDANKAFKYTLTGSMKNGTQKSMGGGTLQPLASFNDDTISLHRTVTDITAQKTSNILAPRVKPVVKRFATIEPKITTLGATSLDEFRMVINTGYFPFTVTENNLSNIVVEEEWHNKADDTTIKAYSFVRANEMRGANTLLLVPSTKDTPSTEYFLSNPDMELKVKLHYLMPDYAVDDATK